MPNNISVQETFGRNGNYDCQLRTSGITNYLYFISGPIRLSNKTFLGILRNTLQFFLFKTVKAFRCSVKSDATLRESLLLGSVICHTLRNKPDGSLSLGVSWIQGQLLCCFSLKELSSSPLFTPLKQPLSSLAFDYMQIVLLTNVHSCLVFKKVLRSLVEWLPRQNNQGPLSRVRVLSEHVE